MTPTTALTNIDRDAERRLIAALRGRGGRLTRADAEVMTGLPGTRVEPALRSLLKTYRSHLAATETGELLYTFDRSLVRRDAEPLGARLARAADVVWRGFVVAFKIAIVAVLVTYFLLFVALLLGLLFARLAGRGNSSGDDDDGFLPLGLIFWLLPWDVGYAGQGYGSPRRVAPRRRPPRRKIHLQVYDFVFGPARPPVDPGAADREALTYIRDHQGRITATDLVLLRGLDLEAAEAEATRLMCDFDGEPEVTADGVVTYVFRDLRVTAGDADGGRWCYAWDKLEARPRLTGNSAGADVVVALVNGFNLVAPFLVVPAALAHFGLHGGAAATWLQVVPFTFSAVFFAVPLGRLAARALREPARRRRNRRRLLLRAIFQPARWAAPGAAPALALPRAPLDPAALLAAAGDDGEPAARRDLDALVAGLAGDVSLDEGDERRLGWITFPRLVAELDAIGQVRAGAPALETSAGAVVFDSAAPLPGAEEPAGRLPPAPEPWRN